MTHNSMMDTKRKRLIFQSNHRGCKEMDMVMGQFCAREVAALSEAEITIYEALLEEDDWDIWGWINGRGEPSNVEYVPLLEKMRDYTPLVTLQEAEG